MRRREFIAALGGATAWPLAARAQHAGKVPRIGLLSPFSPSTTARWHEAFRQGLRERGWVEGQTISIEYRYAAGRAGLLRERVADLVRLNVDVIVTSTLTDALAAKTATRMIPIVVASAGDPVASGLVESLNRPGGNVTGLSQLAPELAGKRLEVLRELVPTLTRLAVLWNSQNPTSTSALTWSETQHAARQLGIDLHSLEAQSADALDNAFDEASKAHCGALFITPDAFFSDNIGQIAQLASRSRLPSMFHLREFAEVGGLLSYGIDRSDQFRRAATYVDKILKGAKPADLPIEQPTKIELVINLKTARALGLTIPPTLLARADEVIE
jgi:putative ABC transport system substrate-binding protein